MRYAEYVAMCVIIGAIASAAVAQGGGAAWAAQDGGGPGGVRVEVAAAPQQPAPGEPQPRPGGRMPGGPGGPMAGGPGSPRGPGGERPFGPPPEKVKVTFLGMAASPVPEALADQLKLPKGVGLVVDFVEKDSPAAAAGMRRHDVLTRLDDQILVNPPQLSVLVRMKKPKDKVTLTFVREGQQEKATVELSEIEMVPPPEERTNTFGPPPDPWRDLFQHFRGERPRPGGPPAVSSSAASFADGEHTLTLTEQDGQKYLVAKDRDGKVVFEGPVETAEQRGKVPPEILKKLETMERSFHKEARAGQPAGARMVGGNASAQVSVTEGGITMTLTNTNGHQTLIAVDASGKVLFEGPVDTQEQRAEVPEPVRGKMEKLMKSSSAVTTFSGGN